MTDITLHGSLSEILQHHALMVDRQLTVTIHQDADYDDDDHISIRDEAHLEQLLQEGLDSGMEPLPPGEWDELRKELRTSFSQQ